MRSCLEVKSTMVANEFIDRYMAAANGEYVKVYLYLMRHQGEDPDTGRIADDLNHTEADVKRALNYWVRQGVLAESGDFGRKSGAACEETGKKAEGDRQKEKETETEADGRQDTAGGGGDPEGEKDTFQTIPARRKLYTPDQVSRLADKEDFTQLLYISQKYMNKVFTPRECEVFAYLYDGIRMPAELLEYLVEYCVQGGHYSIRYLESVALNWHERGIDTVDRAREYTAAFNKDGFAVMRAFGINDRRPGEAEQQMIQKWFKELGFTREIVLEACSRTLKAIHKPSFSYADKILSEWKKGGVRVLADVARMDERRENKKEGKTKTQEKSGKNQFHNFEQRNTDYDAMVLERLKERLGEG